MLYRIILHTRHLDFIEWCSRRLQCRVRRFWGTDPDRRGILVHRRGGGGGATWIIDYDAEETDDDEAGIHLDGRTFKVGEYVSVGTLPERSIRSRSPR